jgi:prophage regulatory protein
MSEDRVLRMPEVCAMVGLKRSAVYELMARGEFPGNGALTEKSRGHLLSHVKAWLRQRFPENWTPPAHVAEADDAMAEWESELDMMGALASVEQLKAHLAQAPGEGDMVSYLRGYIAGHAAAKA